MNKILVVIDMQNDFIDGALGTPEAQAIVPKVVEKIKNFKGDRVYFTQDTHFDDYLKTQEGKKLPVEHCIFGTLGWDMPAEIRFADPKLNSWDIIEKQSFGYVYWWEEIDDVPEEIEIIGLCTDICVISNAMILRATYPEARIVVDAACCAGVTPESHKRALEAMKMCQIDIINEED